MNIDRIFFLGLNLTNVVIFLLQDKYDAKNIRS